MAQKISKAETKEQYEKYARNVSEDDVSDVLNKEEAVMGKAAGPLEKFAQDMKLLFSIVKDYANGSYRQLPWTTIAGIVGSLVCVFSPIDFWNTKLLRIEYRLEEMR